jgi:aminoglycoside 3-N-acetyltransferase
VTGLRHAGVVPGDVCFLHTDIRVFGRLKTTDITLLLNSLEEALIDAVGPQGTLVLPAFTYSFCNNETFDVQQSPTKMGVLNEHFRQRADVARTSHGIFSVAVWGSKQAELAVVDDDSFGADSIFGLLHRHGGKIVFFGTPMLTTYIHYVEQSHGVPYRYYKTFSGVVIDRGVRTNRQCRFYVRRLDLNVATDLARLEHAMRAEGLVKSARIGDGEILVVSADDLYRRAWQMLDEDIYSLLKEPPAALPAS